MSDFLDQWKESVARHRMELEAETLKTRTAERRGKQASEEAWTYHEQAQDAGRRAGAAGAALSAVWEDLEGMHDAGCFPSLRPTGGCRACGAQSRIEGVG